MKSSALGLLVCLEWKIGGQSNMLKRGKKVITREHLYPRITLYASEAGWSESSFGYLSTTKELSMQTKPTHKSDSPMFWFY